MLDALFPDDPSSGPEPNTAWHGIIAGDPDDGLVEVVLPAYSVNLKFGPCPYMAKPADGPPVEPSRGDKALVVFDDKNDPWVAVWSPA